MKQTIAKGIAVVFAIYAVSLIARHFLAEKQAGMITAGMIYLLWAIKAHSRQTDPNRRRRIIIGALLTSFSPLVIIASSQLNGANMDLLVASTALMLIMFFTGLFLTQTAAWPRKQSENNRDEEPPYLSHGKRKRSKRKGRPFLFADKRSGKILD